MYVYADDLILKKAAIFRFPVSTSHAFLVVIKPSHTHVHALSTQEEPDHYDIFSLIYGHVSVCHVKDFFARASLSPDAFLLKTLKTCKTFSPLQYVMIAMWQKETNVTHMGPTS